MKYTVKYKKRWFWKRIKNVIGDGYVEGRNVRFFILEDKTMIEIPAYNIIFKFPPERETLLKKNEKED